MESVRYEKSKSCRRWTVAAVVTSTVAVACVLLLVAATKSQATRTANNQGSDRITERSCQRRCEADKTYDPDRCPRNESDGPCLDRTGRCSPNAYICLAGDHDKSPPPSEGSPRRRTCNGQTFDVRRQADSYRLCQMKSRISDGDLLNMSIKLWEEDHVNRINVNVSWQGKTSDGARADEAPRPLFNELPEEFVTVPLYVKQIALFDVYVRDDSVPDPLTPEEWATIDRFLDEVMKTDVMKQTHQFLASKGVVESDAGEFQDRLWEIWYSQYKRSKALSSCGAEHVQVGETKGDEISGLHNWIRFALLEHSGHVNYLGYVRHASLAGEAHVIRNPFFWDTYFKSTGGFFIGTSPAFDMSIYTLCFYARPNANCRVTVGGLSLAIQTFVMDYDGHALVGSSYPQY